MEFQWLVLSVLLLELFSSVHSSPVVVSADSGDVHENGTLVFASVVSS